MTSASLAGFSNWYIFISSSEKLVVVKVVGCRGDGDRLDDGALVLRDQAVILLGRGLRYNLVHNVHAIKHLSEDGLLVIVVTVDATTGVVIAGPDIVSRGFVYVKEAEALMEELRNISQMALDRCAVDNRRDWNSLKSAIKGDVSDYLFKKTKRSPMVLPIIMEI